MSGKPSHVRDLLVLAALVGSALPAICLADEAGDFRKAAASVLELVRTAAQLPQGEVEERDALGRSFDVHFDELQRLQAHESVRASTRATGSPLENAVFDIALEREKAPETFEEIEQTYIKGITSKLAVARSAPRLREEHLQSKYGPAWHYYLLRPQSSEASYLHDRRVADALTRLAGPVSHDLLVFAFESAVDDDPATVRWRADRQRLLLSILGRLPAQPSLLALLRCLDRYALAESAVARGVARKEGRWDAAEYVFRLLSDQENYGVGDEWIAVIDSVPAERVPLRHVALLQRVKKYRSR